MLRWILINFFKELRCCCGACCACLCEVRLPVHGGKVAAQVAIWQCGKAKLPPI